jgi:hypothetical protein
MQKDMFFYYLLLYKFLDKKKKTTTKMVLNEKYSNNNNYDDEDDDERRSSSLSDISHEQIFMPLSPTPDSLSSFRQSTNTATTTKTIITTNKKNIFKINSPKSLNEGGSRFGGPIHSNVTQSVTNTPIRKTRVPVSTQQQQSVSKQQGNNKNPLSGDFLNTFFELDPILNDYDINLYTKNFANYNPNYQTSRLVDYDEDYLLFDRIKQRIAKRDLSIINRKTPFLANESILNNSISNNKEINLKIDITTDGAKIREMTKSRNSNFANSNRTTTNSRVLNIDYLNDENYFNKNQFVNNSRKNTIAALPSLNRVVLKKDSVVYNNNNNNNNNGNYDFSLSKQFNIDNNALKNPNNIHDYLYSLSKKTQFDSKF